MAGASDQTKRIKYLNANWNPYADDGAGFELLVVTDDDQRHVLPISSGDLAALGSLLARDPVLLFDPQAQTLIIANLIGQWLPPQQPSGTT